MAGRYLENITLINNNINYNKKNTLKKSFKNVGCNL